MLHTASQRGMSSIFIVHRRELINQSSRAFKEEGLEHGIISSGFFEDRKPNVQLASVQTLARRLSRVRQPRLVVWDESHHIAAESWGRIFRGYPETYHIGLTATPERLDGKGLGTYFKEIVCGPSVQTLIQQGYLSPYRLYAPTRFDVSKLHIRMGDYEKTELAQAVDKPSITGDAIAHYKRLCPGRRAIVFCVSREHSKHVIERFKDAGIRAAHVDGETPSEERDRAIRDFSEGHIQVLSNVDLFGEGFDVPAIEAAIMLRPTQSLGVYLQQVGRAFRPSIGKSEAIILDHVGNYERHGLPDDERQWSLEGRDARVGKSRGLGISVRICPKCFAAQSANLPACKFCGYMFETKPREVEQKEGELSEVDLERTRIEARRTQGRVQTLEELIALGRQRGYRYPERWAWFVMRGRQAKKLGKVA